MQPVTDYTTARAGLSTAQAFYSVISCIAVLDRVQQWELVIAARSGDLSAYDRLVEASQRFILAVARRLARFYKARDGVEVDPMDMVQAANVHILTYRATILASPAPPGALFKAAANAMRGYYAEHGGLVRVPYTSYRRGRRAPQVISLDYPLNVEPDRTLLDLIAASS